MTSVGHHMTRRNALLARQLCGAERPSFIRSIVAPAGLCLSLAMALTVSLLIAWGN